jgi:hypothetical protein
MAESLVAEFETAEQIVAAAKALHAKGYRNLDGYTPFPILELERALGLKRSPANWYVFGAGLFGAGFAYWFQWFCNAFDYPLNVGGRPPHSAPTQIPITFETTVLFGGLTAFFFLLVNARLPTAISHPVHEVPGFERATIDRFFLAVSANDPRFDLTETSTDLEELGAMFVSWTGAGR